MLTPFGKAVRKIRIDHNMKLSTMAERLDVKPAFLTSVETGRKSVPSDFPERDDERFLKHSISHWTPDGPELSYAEVRMTRYQPEVRTY